MNVNENKLRIYFDMEFTGLQQNTSLISLGCVSESGTTFYAEFTDYDRKQLDDWLKEHIINKLTMKRYNDPFSNQTDERLNNPEAGAIYSEEVKGETPFIKEKFLLWLANEARVSKKQLQFFSDCYAYDWVLFNSLVGEGGSARGIPDYIYYIPVDLSTLLWATGIDPDVNREQFGEIREPDSKTMKHNALWDAQVIKACFEKIGVCIPDTSGGKLK